MSFHRHLLPETVGWSDGCSVVDFIEFAYELSFMQMNVSLISVSLSLSESSSNDISNDIDTYNMSGNKIFKAAEIRRSRCKLIWMWMVLYQILIMFLSFNRWTSHPSPSQMFVGGWRRRTSWASPMETSVSYTDGGGPSPHAGFTTHPGLRNMERRADGDSISQRRIKERRAVISSI